MLIVIVQRRILRGFAFPPVFKHPNKMKSFGLNETKLFHFHQIFKKKEIQTHTFIHMNPLSRNPGSVTVVLAACSHVYLLACMQQCVCLSGGARSIFVWASVYRFSLCALGQNNGSEMRASSECPDYCVYAHARLSCRCSHISWHVLQIVQVNL